MAHHHSQFVHCDVVHLLHLELLASPAVHLQNLEAHFKAKGKEVTKESIEEYAWDTLNSGKVSAAAPAY